MQEENGLNEMLEQLASGYVLVTAVHPSLIGGAPKDHRVLANAQFYPVDMLRR
jgi:hypothetical protein